MCSCSWELGLCVQRKRAWLPKPAFTAVTSPLLPLQKSIWHLAANWGSEVLAGFCLLQKNLTWGCGFLRQDCRDGWAVFLTAALRREAWMGRKGYKVVFRCVSRGLCSSGCSSVEMEERTGPKRGVRIKAAEGDVSEETSSAVQLVIAPVEGRFLTFPWVQLSLFYT